MNTYLSFVITNELFAINVSHVLEVLEQQNVTKVPNAPEAIKGIINFRGEVVPVFETRTKFGFTDRHNDDAYVIIVLDMTSQNEDFRIGAIVDRVQDVISISDENIMPVPAMSSSFNASYLQGIIRLNERFVMLLNVDKVFTSSEISNVNENANI